MAKIYLSKRTERINWNITLFLYWIAVHKKWALIIMKWIDLRLISQTSFISIRDKLFFDEICWNVAEIVKIYYAGVFFFSFQQLKMWTKCISQINAIDLWWRNSYKFQKENIHSPFSSAIVDLSNHMTHCKFFGHIKNDSELCFNHFWLVRLNILTNVGILRRKNFLFFWLLLSLSFWQCALHFRFSNFF